MRKQISWRASLSPPKAGLWDRFGQHWVVVDVDGTKQVARQRALPQLESLPVAHRRFDQVAAPGYFGRKRGEVVRTRTTVLQPHTHQWMGTFSGAGNGDYRRDLKRAASVIATYATTLLLPPSQILVRLDGLYGNAAPLTDVLTPGLGLIARSKDDTLLDLEVVHKRLTRPPDQECTHPESGTSRALYDGSEVPLTPGGPRLRLIVTTHPATSSPPSIGVQRQGMVYELFVSTLASPAFTRHPMCWICICIEGPLKPFLPMKTPSKILTAGVLMPEASQEFWQILSQWMWNLRLELGQHLCPTAMQTTEFAPVLETSQAPTVLYGPAQWARLRGLPALPDRLLRFNPMEAYSVPPIILSTHKNADPSVMALTVCCMPLASAIVAAVACVRSRKKAFPPPNPDGSVRFSGLSQPLKRVPLRRFRQRPTLLQRCLNRPRVPRSFGGIGPGVNSDGDG